MTTRRSAPRRLGRPSRPTDTVRPFGALLAAVVLVGQLLAVVPVRAAAQPDIATQSPRANADAPAPAADVAQGVGDLAPGVQYEEAMAHAADQIDFTPGGRVTVGFRPRSGDAWEVGGRAPRALPAGSASGRDMLPNASTGTAAPSDAPPDEPVDEPVEAPVDAPADDPGVVPEADGASARLPLEPDTVAVDGTRLRRQVMGFLPYWEVNDAVLDYELLSTIAYFSVGSDKNGNLLKLDPDGTPTTGWGGWTSSRLTSIINGAHAKGTRVVLTISVFAWTTGQAQLQGQLLGNPTARLNLAKQAAAAVRARGADGINLDFEPIASGYDDEYVAFVRTVRAELDKQAPGYQLTFDTTGYIGNYPIEAATAPGAADAIFIMGYDYRTAGAAYAGSIDPLAGPAYDLEDTVNAYAARVSPSKLILGVPWYGRAWSTVSDKVNAKTQSGSTYGTSNTVLLDTALDYAAQYGRRWDSREQSAWVAYWRENTWRQLYYDDGQAAKARYDLINRKGLRGAGIWALGYDADRIEMRQALAEKFLNDSTAPLAGIRALAPTQTSETFTVAWTGQDDTAIRDYDVQVSIQGGPWHDWLIKTTQTSHPYFGASGYGFAFRVRARDLQGNASPWDVSSVYRPQPTLAVGAFGTVVASTLNVRTSPDTSAAVVTTVDAGTLLAITDGPVSADGYSWYEVTVPINEWSPVGGVQRDVWVAASDASTSLVSAAPAPNTTRVQLPPGVAKPPGARFLGLAPTRVVDTRAGVGLPGPLTSGAARMLSLAGRGGVAANAIAVTGTIAVVGQTSGGYLSIGPFAATVATSSVVNAPKGDVRAAGFTVALNSSGPVALLWTGAGGSQAHAIVDVTGYFVQGSTGSTFVPIAPARIVDTRFGNGLTGTMLSGTPRAFAVAGHGGVKAGATAVTGNLAVVGPGTDGYVALGPTIGATPGTSSLNVLKGDTRAAAVTMPLDASGRLALVWKGTPGSRTHVIFDVTGYFVGDGTGATYHGIDSSRVLDSRFANGLAGPFTNKTTRSLQAAGRGAVPVDAVALTGGAVVVQPTGAGWLIVGPAGSPIGTTSTINIPKGDVRANGLTSRTGPGGVLSIVFQGAAGSSANVIVDVTGYFR